MLALTNFWIYCDLFHHTISETYLPQTFEPLSTATRRDWLKFCIPDANCNGDDFPDQYEQLDLQQFLYGLQTDTCNLMAVSHIE